MNKIIIFVMLATTMILTVSMATAINTTNKNTQNEKESPLFRIRSERATCAEEEKTNMLKEKIRTWFTNGRAFLKFQLLGKGEVFSIRQQLGQKDPAYKCTCQICRTVYCTFCPACRSTYDITCSCTAVNYL